MATASVVAHDHLNIPKGATRPEALAWFRREVHGLLDRYVPDRAFYKAIEATARKPNVQRAEFEGVLQEAAFSHGSQLTVERRYKRQIAKHMGIDGSAKYLTRSLTDYGLAVMNTTTYAEATATALCGLEPK